MTSSFSWRRLGVGLALAYAAATVVCTVLGCARAYSPIPYYDMWDGFYADFLFAPAGWSRWWCQHNEHRIVLTRLLFWMDWHWAGGRGILLAAANLVLAGAGAGLLLAFLRERGRESGLGNSADGRATVLMAGALVVTLALSWLQVENLTWQFQGQFFLAQYLPLSGAYALQRRARTSRGVGWFAAACVAGILSLGSMANGVLALPMLAALALWLGLGRRRALVLAALALAGALAYGWGYQTPRIHGSPWAHILGHPWGFLAYACVWLGGPAQAWLSRGPLEWRAALALATGLLFLGLSAAALWLRGPAHAWTPARKALFAFIAYILLTGVLTASGRLQIGLDQAMAGRYETPVLAAWCALLLLFLPEAADLLSRRPRTVACLALAAGLALGLNVERHALDDGRLEVYVQDRAMLALSLGLRDPQAVAVVYPGMDIPLEVVGELRRRGWGFASRPPWIWARPAWGRELEGKGPAGDRAVLDADRAVPGNPRVLAVLGHARIPASARLLVLTDPEGRVVGEAVPWPGGRGGAGFFGGYLRADQVKRPLRLERLDGAAAGAAAPPIGGGI